MRAAAAVRAEAEKVGVETAGAGTAGVVTVGVATAGAERAGAGRVGVGGWGVEGWAGVGCKRSTNRVSGCLVWLKEEPQRAHFQCVQGSLFLGRDTRFALLSRKIVTVNIMQPS